MNCRSDAIRMASAGWRLWPLRRASVWSRVMPESMMPFSVPSNCNLLKNNLDIELTPCAYVLREEGLEIESLELLLQTLAGRAMRVVAVGDLDIIDEPEGEQKAQAEARAAVLLDLNASDDISDWDRERA